MSYLVTGRYGQVLGMFLLGVLIARAALPLIRDKARLALAWWVVPGLVGLVASLVYAGIKGAIGGPYALDHLGLLQAVVYHIGAPTLALGLAGAFYSLWSLRWFPPLSANFAVLGRMALTNYIL